MPKGRVKSKALSKYTGVVDKATPELEDEVGVPVVMYEVVHDIEAVLDARATLRELLPEAGSQN